MFKFSMQTALDVRGKQEKFKMREFAVALAQQQELEAQIEQVSLDVAQSNQHVDQQKHAGLYVASGFRFHEQFKQKKGLERSRLVAKQVEAAELTEGKRLNLVEAAKNRKTLEILREREWEKFLAVQAKVEREFADEVASNQHVRHLR